MSDFECGPATRPEITERVKTYEDALKVIGKRDSKIKRFFRLLFYPKSLRTYFDAQYKAIIIVEALNEGWKTDWSDINQEKYIPYFFMSPFGFLFHDTHYCYSYPYVGLASCHCFKTRALAAYFGTQFLDLNRDIIMK